jgi:PadR family transcriptional regulator, regulatory protein PadR
MELAELEEQVIFAVLALHPNAYDVSVVEHIEERTGHEPSVGSVYACLERLEEKGFVKARHGGPATEPGGKQKYFEITEPGLRALRQSMQATSDVEPRFLWKRGKGPDGGP